MAAETETTGAVPATESVDLAGAVALMGSLAEQGKPDGEQADAGNAAEEGGDTEAVDIGDLAEGEEGDAAEGEESEQQDEGEAEGAEAAPEFWSAEDKAAWAKVPPELRPTIAKYEQQRVQFVNEKARESAAVRAQATEEVQKANATIDQAAQWWAQAGPALQQAFADKWSGVNWSELAEKNPAEWARLNQMRQDEAVLLTEANRRGQADIEARNQRAEQAFQQVRQAEHAKVAAKLSDHFGTPEKATKTYDELGKFLFSKGIPADRINQIHEAPIIEIALKAMLYEQARTKASTVTNPGAANISAKQTPTRVAPGPAARTGNRFSDAARQVGERFRKSGGNSIADAAELIRLNGL